MMRALGIYCGPKSISLVETEGQKVVNNVLIPLQRLSGTAIEEKIPEEIKIAAAIKDELRKNNIDAKEAGLVLLGRDLIIRTFYMPVLPSSELYAAVRFEAKKYIPFKVDELIYDFQVSLDRANRKNMVLFVGVKRDNLDKYISIFSQLNIKLNSIEYSGFSILRLLQLSKVKEKGITAVVDIDLSEEDEVNFIVLENGMPLFSRDIILSADANAAADGTAALKLDLAQSLDKLKVELRISLDFYLRKFPTKNINNIVVIAPDDYRQELESFVRERGIGIRFADCRKFVDRPMAFSLGFFKAYAVNLKKTIKSNIVIDLLPTKIKAKGMAQASAGGPYLFGFKIDIKFLVLAVAMIGITLGVNYYRFQPVKVELDSVLGKRPQVATVKAELSLDELKAIDRTYNEKVRAITDILKKRIFITGQLDSVPRVIPEGLWLSGFNFKKSDVNFVLTITGSCYLADVDKERETVTKFKNDLKDNPQFSKFTSINFLSLERGQLGRVTLSNFVIECRSP
jgi:hypothetical protein